MGKDFGDREPCAISRRGIRITQARGASQGNLSSFREGMCGPGQEKADIRRSVTSGVYGIYLAQRIWMGDAAWSCGAVLRMAVLRRGWQARHMYQLATVR